MLVVIGEYGSEGQGFMEILEVLEEFCSGGERVECRLGKDANS